MKKTNSTAKVPLTIRTDNANVEDLKRLATEQSTTVSALVNKAISMLLAGQYETGETGEIIMTKEDLEGLTRVIETIGKPVSLPLLLQILSLQKRA